MHVCIFISVCVRVVVGVWARERACDCTVVALLIQHATRMPMLSAVPLAPPHFSTLSHKRFWEKGYFFSATFILFLGRIQWDIVKFEKKIFMWNTRYACRILIKLKFSRQIFEKKSKLSNFIKFRLVGSELFHAGRTGGQTDTKKLIVAFCNFANAPKKAVFPARVSCCTKVPLHFGFTLCRSRFTSLRLVHTWTHYCGTLLQSWIRIVARQPRYIVATNRGWCGAETKQLRFMFLESHPNGIHRQNVA
jgi:hypothetical protein